MTTHNFGAIYRVLYDFLFLIAKEERLKWLNWWVRFCARRFVFLLPSVGLTFENLCVDVFHYYRNYTTQKKSERTSFMSADLMDGFICPPLMLLLLFSMFSYCLWWFLMRARRFFCDVGWFFTAWKKWTTTTRDDIARKKSKIVMWRNTRTENKIYTAIQVNKKLYYHERINRVFSLSLSLSLSPPKPCEWIHFIHALPSIVSLSSRSVFTDKLPISEPFQIARPFWIRFWQLVRVFIRVFVILIHSSR